MSRRDPAPSTMVVSSFRTTIRRAWPSTSRSRSFRSCPQVLGDDLGAGEDANVVQDGLAAVAVGRGLDGADVDRAAHFVDDQGGEHVAVHVLGHEQHVALPRLHDLLQQRQHVLGATEFVVGDEDERVVQLAGHRSLVGHEIGRDIAAVKLHAVHEVELQRVGSPLFHRHRTVLANPVQRRGDLLADGRVAGRDRGHPLHLLGLADFAALLVQRSLSGRHRLFHALLDDHRVQLGGNRAQSVLDHALGQHRGGGGAVASHVVGFGGRFLDELGAHVLEVIRQVNIASDGHTVVGDDGRPEFAREPDVASPGPQRDAHRVGDRVDAIEQRAARGFIENQVFGHADQAPSWRSRTPAG